jgi:hypothetical protein
VSRERFNCWQLPLAQLAGNSMRAYVSKDWGEHRQSCLRLPYMLASACIFQLIGFVLAIERDVIRGKI